MVEIRGVAGLQGGKCRAKEATKDSSTWYRMEEESMRNGVIDRV